MSYTYATYKAALAELMVVNDVDDANFNGVLPSIIDYAEQRIYRELDLLNTVTRDASGVFSVNNRNFTLPTASGVFVTVTGVNAITPAGSAPDTGTRKPLVPTTLEFMDTVWPSSTGAGLPTQFAMVTQGLIVVGPWPDAGYTAEVIGTIRPAPLSASNATTFLTLYLPDLFMAASMIFASGFQKNFGGQSDDPRMSQSWESQYQVLFASANAEEMRKRWQGPGWSSQPPAPMASPRT